MRRVVALFLPTFPTDQIRRRNGGIPARELPMVTAIQESNRRILASVDDAAGKLKLACGMTVAHAQTLVPELIVEDANPEEDEAALARLALWCTRYSPLVTPCPPDTIFIDVAGSSHLFKGEAALLKDMRARLLSAQLSARAALADTPGCAWAVAHYGRDDLVPPGRASAVLGGLPIAALRLPDQEIAGLRDVGIERIAQLATLPRASLRQRFSGDVLLRLDQALGAAVEVLAPVIPREVPRMTLKFAEPIGNPDDLHRVMTLLCEKLMLDLGARGVGARRLDMVFQRVDNITQAIRIGTSKPNRDAKHLTKLLAERLVLVDPGFGIEEASLTASWVEALTERQTVGAHVADAGAEVDVAQLVDTLCVRLGNERVFRLAPVESDIPERSVRRIAATARSDGAIWPQDLPRPARLLSPPEPVNAVAEIPDSPPRFFIWRKVRHRVARADGPERILGDWWLSDREVGLQRDYYRVETDAGERFWLFRDASAGSGGPWWLHGIGEA
jgi:protein ImuB